MICKSNYRQSQPFPDEKGNLACYKSTPAEQDYPSGWPLQLPYKTPEFHDRLDELGDIWDMDLFDISVLYRFQEGEGSAAQVIDRIAFISTFGWSVIYAMVL